MDIEEIALELTKIYINNTVYMDFEISKNLVMDSYLYFLGEVSAHDD